MTLATQALERLGSADLLARTGRVTRILPTYVEADGPGAPVGTLCAIQTRRASGSPDSSNVLAQIVAVHPRSVILAPLETAYATYSGAEVVACAGSGTAPVGDAFLGRAVDALGRPIDGKGAIQSRWNAKLAGNATTPLDRATPMTPLETGVRAIDGLLTLGQGQRIGVFAAAGVGKTSLMGQIARQVGVDRCVICLVGERGREVEALWSNGLSPAAKARSTLVAATSDQSAAMRVRASDYALALAEHWRSQGHHVLLLLDSVTRLAMALREIGLAAGEPPTVRAYTPGVFAAIPRIVERCGALKSGGAITAVLTVLAETDDVDDPICEMIKSLVDGHIVLSRSLAEQGQYPAIDVPRSVSRLASALVSEEHRAAARRAANILGVYEASRTLIEAGVYVRGTNPEIDQCLERRPALLDFLRQDQSECTPLRATSAALKALVGASS